MSDTGATPEQIEAAVDDYLAYWHLEDETVVRSKVNIILKHLIPPGYAIIGPVELAALRRVLEVITGVKAVVGPYLTATNVADMADDIDLLSALIGEPT
jgi:hypothetical protein